MDSTSDRRKCRRGRPRRCGASYNGGYRLMINDKQPASDEFWMEEALRAAQRALEAGEVPVGAVVVCGGKIIARGWNRNIAGSDPTAHAEMVALREAGAAIGNHRLEDCEL